MCSPLVGLTWSPMPDSEGAPTNSQMRVAFSDYPDPDSVGPDDFLLTTGVFYYTGTYAVDLAGKAVVFQPAGMLRTNLGYTLSVGPPLQSLSGCPTTLDQRSFRTGDGPAARTPRLAVPFSDVAPILASHCGGSGCHRQDPAAGGGCLTAPAAGLSLCDADAVSALVDVRSRQVARLTLVAPNDSARSYLLRKLLPASPGGGPIPTVLGQREPPGAPLTDDEIATVAGWIDTGAGK